MADMPRQRPPHLQREVNRHGKTVWYVRVGKGPRIRLRAAYGTPEFQAEYDAAVRGDAPARPAGVQTGTLAWLVAQYRETKVWSDLSRATRRQRENIFRHVLESAGKQPFTAITDTAIDKGIDRRKATPAQARHFLDTMRGLFKWAAKAKHVKADPTQGITVAKPKTKGFPVWTPAEIEAYERRWPLGTRERVVFDVYRYTGLRRGDAAIVGKQHVRNGVIVIDTQRGFMSASCRNSRSRSRPGRAATCLSSPPGPAARSSRKPWARSSRKPAAPLAFARARTVCASMQRRHLPRPAERSRSLKPCSAGKAAGWLRSTPAALIASGWPQAAWRR
jgi:hypothetical protein